MTLEKPKLPTRIFLTLILVPAAVYILFFDRVMPFSEPYKRWLFAGFIGLIGSVLRGGKLAARIFALIVFLSITKFLGDKLFFEPRGGLDALGWIVTIAKGTLVGIPCIYFAVTGNLPIHWISRPKEKEQVTDA